MGMSSDSVVFNDSLVVTCFTILKLSARRKSEQIVEKVTVMFSRVVQQRRLEPVVSLLSATGHPKNGSALLFRQFSDRILHSLKVW